MNSRTSSDRRRDGATVTDAASKPPRMAILYRLGGGPEQVRPHYRLSLLLARRLGLDDLLERRLTVLDGVQAVVGERSVAVLVDGVHAQGRLAVLDVLEQLLADRLPVVGLVANRLEGVQRQRHRLVAVDGVR